MIDEDEPEKSDADFLMEVSTWLFHNASPAMGLVQSYVDRLSRMSRRPDAAARLEQDMRRYIYDRVPDRRITCLDAYAERAGLEPWKDRQA